MSKKVGLHPGRPKKRDLSLDERLLQLRQLSVEKLEKSLKKEDDSAKIAQTLKIIDSIIRINDSDRNKVDELDKLANELKKLYKINEDDDEL